MMDRRNGKDWMEAEQGKKLKQRAWGGRRGINPSASKKEGDLPCRLDGPAGWEGKRKNKWFARLGKARWLVLLYMYVGEPLQPTRHRVFSPKFKFKFKSGLLYLIPSVPSFPWSFRPAGRCCQHALWIIYRVKTTQLFYRLASWVPTNQILQRFLWVYIHLYLFFLEHIHLYLV